MKSIIQYDTGSISNLGIHRNPGLEIIYLREGSLEWQIDGHTETVRHDTIFFSLPWQEHGSTREYEPGHYWSYVLIKLARDYVLPQSQFQFHSEYGFSKKESASLSTVLCTSQRHDYPISSTSAYLLPAIVEELRLPHAYSDTYVISMIRTLIVDLVRTVETMPETALENECEEESDSVKRVKELIREISRRSDEEWTLSSMADECFLGRTQFATLLKRETGDTPVMFLNRLRVQKALNLLRSTDMSITDIAFECGFNTSQYFAKVFKTFVLCDARTYRRRLREKES